MNNSTTTTQISSLLGGVLVNVLVAMLFAMSWNLGPARVGLPFLTIPQGIALFFCVFTLLFWPLYLVTVVALNMYKLFLIQLTAAQKNDKSITDSTEHDI